MTVPSRLSTPSRSWLDFFEKVINDSGRASRFWLLWTAFGLVVALLLAILVVPATMAIVLRPNLCGSVLRSGFGALWQRVRK